MKTNWLSNNFIFIALAVCVVAFWGCPQPTTCPAPTDLAIDIQSRTSLNYKWEGNNSAQLYQYTFKRENGDAIEGEGQDTLLNIPVQPPLKNGEQISFNVRSVCDDGTTSAYARIDSVYRNIASVEVIYRESDLSEICENTTCKYIRFDSAITDMCGLAKSIIDSFEDKIFLKEDFCNCYKKCIESPSPNTLGFKECLQEKQKDTERTTDCN